MKARTVTTSAILSVFMLAVSACGDSQPLPDIEATVEARLEEERSAAVTTEATAHAVAKVTVVPTAQIMATAIPVIPSPTPLTLKRQDWQDQLQGIDQNKARIYEYFKNQEPSRPGARAQVAPRFFYTE